MNTVDDWSHILKQLPLPPDCSLVSCRNGHAIAISLIADRAYRIRSLEIGDDRVDNVTYAHRISRTMFAAGLNVLPACADEPHQFGGYVISASPLGQPLSCEGWTTSDAFGLGRELAKWASYSDSTIQVLDVPAYCAGRIEWSLASNDRSLCAAARQCAGMLDRLSRNTPFTDYVDAAGATGLVHGDLHSSNIVRLGESRRLFLIDLDTVKIGPPLYDVAVSLVYQRRYNPAYPGTKILQGYLSSMTCADDTAQIAALQNWKEISSMTQLLLRWNIHGVPEEFWRRTDSGYLDSWSNIVGTPTLGVADLRMSCTEPREQASAASPARRRARSQPPEKAAPCP